MQEETVSDILNIEHAALNVYEDAQHEARKIIAEAKKLANAKHQQALEATQQQASRIIEEGRQVAEAARANIIAHAGADAQNLETVSARHIEEAVTFVVNKVIALG